MNYFISEINVFLNYIKIHITDYFITDALNAKNTIIKDKLIFYLMKKQISILKRHWKQ